VNSLIFQGPELTSLSADFGLCCEPCGFDASRSVTTLAPMGIYSFFLSLLPGDEKLSKLGALKR
jgi:hypothetical protein